MNRLLLSLFRHQLNLKQKVVHKVKHKKGNIKNRLSCLFSSCFDKNCGVSLSLRHFFAKKNGGMKPSGFASWHAVPLHASQDALHILRHRRKMLHKKRLTMKQLHFILL